MLRQSVFVIDDRSQIGTARRAAAELAASLGFDDVQAGKVGLAVTELGTNIVNHAGRGRLVLTGLESNGCAGIELMALDKGPGISDIGASLRDGHSTAGTMGGGLGALSRLSTEFQVFTQPGRGTALRLEIWSKPPASRASAFQIGGICFPRPGETVSGDGWGLEVWRDQVTVLLADGLGHGLEAYEAARSAVETLAAHAKEDPVDLIQSCHTALARTRGAAIAVAKLVVSERSGRFAGVGNIVSRVEEARVKSRHLVSYNGSVGHVLRKVQEVPFAWPEGTLLILHSDGLGTHWDLAAYPGLSSRHPALIAAVLYRDYDRGRDDVSVVVLRNCGSGS
jgi:anti-sigma regulatory factor (Ser/Thr protein kinase)